MNERTARLLLGVAMPVALGLLGFVPYLLAWSDFPARVASHFSASGVPDGSMTPADFLTVNGLLFAVGAVLLVGVAFVRRPLFDMMAIGIAMTGGVMASVAAAVLLSVALTQRGLEDWTEASSGWPWPMVLILVAVTVPVAVVATRLAMRLPSKQSEVAAGARPVLDLRSGEQAVWSGQLRSVALTAVGLFTMLLSVVIWFTATEWATVIVLVICGTAILATASLRVRADREGLHVKYGVLPWPQTHLSVDRIESAAVIDVRPKEWGGWGYRGSLRFMKRAAAVLRAGPGIRVDLRDGKVFVVTVDNPENAVALLNAQIGLRPVVG